MEKIKCEEMTVVFKCPKDKTTQIAEVTEEIEIDFIGDYTVHGVESVYVDVLCPGCNEMHEIELDY